MSIFLIGWFCLLSCCGIAQDIQITHGPYLQKTGEHEVTIVWTTDQPAVSWVDVAPADEEPFDGAAARRSCYQTQDGNRLVSRLHKVTLSGLERGTAYRYRVFSTAAIISRLEYGQTVSSDPSGRCFTTLDSHKPAISFTVLNDLHGRTDDLKALSRHVAYGRTDLVIFNGDMVDFMQDEQQFLSSCMDEAVKGFAGEVPVFYARGNHETRGLFNWYFSDYFPSADGRPYYAFRQGPVHFTVLDSGEDKPDAHPEYYGLAQFDAYRTEQREWLEKELQSESFRTASYRVVIVHIPPLGSDEHGNLEVREKFLPLLNKAGITVMFCGHTHNYAYFEPAAGLHDFPILINAANTAIEVMTTPDGLSVCRKDITGQALNNFTYRPAVR